MMKEFKNSLRATMPLVMVVLGFAVAGPALSQSRDAVNGSAPAKSIVEAPSGKLPHWKSRRKATYLPAENIRPSKTRKS